MYVCIMQNVCVVYSKKTHTRSDGIGKNIKEKNEWQSTRCITTERKSLVYCNAMKQRDIMYNKKRIKK